MFSLDDRPYTLCDRISRRELMRIGGLNLLGLSLPALLAAQARRRRRRRADPTFGRAKNIIYLWLQGGPPQHETFDPKPDAPLEIRGAVSGRSRPTCRASSSASCCRAPRRIADKLAVVRSLSTDDNTHDTSGYWVLTGEQVSRRQCPRDQAQRLAVLRLGRQDAQAQRARAGAVERVDSRHHAAQRQRAPGRPDRRLPRRAVGSRPVHRRPVGRRTTGSKGWRCQPAFRRCGWRAGVSLFEQVGRHFDAVRTGRRRARLRRHSPGGLRPAHLRRAREAFRGSQRAGSRSASATARTAGASACCWPGG